MPDLTEELEIIVKCIQFAQEKNLDFQITRYPTISKHKKIEIDLGQGPIHSRPEMHFGASFATIENGNLKYKHIHVYPLDNDHMDETENFRLYLQENFKDIACKW